MMMENSYSCYNEILDVFEIYSGSVQNVVAREQGKYGIEILFDINNKPIGIIIPEPDVLFGFDPEVLRGFACTRFT